MDLIAETPPRRRPGPVCAIRRLKDSNPDLHAAFVAAMPRLVAGERTIADFADKLADNHGLSLSKDTISRHMLRPGQSEIECLSCR